MVKVKIKFNGKELHEKKSFKDLTGAFDYICTHHSEIESINFHHIMVYDFDLGITRILNDYEIKKIICEGYE